MNEEIKVPKVWLETLLKRTNQTSQALEEMDSQLYGSDRTLLAKLRVYELLGYASSAETLLKYHQSQSPTLTK